MREALEEAAVAVDPAPLSLAAMLAFRFAARPAWDMDVWGYVATTWRGDPVEYDEVASRWYPVDALPFPAMWDDARHWLPAGLAGDRIRARVTYGDDGSRVRLALAEPLAGPPTALD